MSTSPMEMPAGAGVAPGPLAQSASARPPRVLRRYAAFDESAVLSGQIDSAWLGRRERSELSAWRDERRRRDWLLGRMIAKQLVATAAQDSQAQAGVPPERIEILSRDAAGRVNRPRIWRDGTLQPWSLSISHSHRGVLAALAVDEGVSVGVDVADCEAFSDGFIDLWFTPAERAWFHDTQSPSIACFIWAAKEALYKACNDGESFAPRDIEVLPDGRCSYRGAPLADGRLQSWTIDGQLAVLATVRSRRT